jgi:ADP-heptose:LPS heptosyltransferase
MRHLTVPRARPLVFRRGAMGDMVILTSLIAALARRFDSPVDVVASGSWTRPLLEGQPGVGDIHVLGSSRTPWPFSAAQRQMVASLAARGPGPVWFCDSDTWAVKLLRRAGYRPEHVLVAKRDCQILPHEHHVDRWLRFARLTPRGCAAVAESAESAESALAFEDLRSPPLAVLPQWRADLDRWLADKGLSQRRLVLVQAGNKRTMRWWAPRGRATNEKYWPEERWGEVIRRVLADDPGCDVLLLGVPAEAALNDEIRAAAAASRVQNVARELPMSRLLALQTRAAGMISVDTGPAHSGAALGCPMVVLFGEARVERYAPRSPTGRVACLQAHPTAAGRRMTAITVEEVHAAWRRIIAGAPPASLVASGQ